LFLSKAERDYLTAKRHFSDDYSYTTKCRLQKKGELFANEELPLLVEQGYLTEIRKLTKNCKVSSDVVVAQPGRALPGSSDSENENKKEKPWAGNSASFDAFEPATSTLPR
jgi:hypothetical protein